MNPDQFWTSLDGQILQVKNKDDRTVALTLAFWPRHPAEFEFLKANLASLKFTERSSLARIGLEMLVHGEPRVEGNRLELTADAFIYDPSFPNATYWKKLLRTGAPVGRQLGETLLDSAHDQAFIPRRAAICGTSLSPRPERFITSRLSCGRVGASFIT